MQKYTIISNTEAVLKATYTKALLFIKKINSTLKESSGNLRNITPIKLARTTTMTSTTAMTSTLHDSNDKQF